MKSGRSRGRPVGSGRQGPIQPSENEEEEDNNASIGPLESQEAENQPENEDAEMEEQVEEEEQEEASTSKSAPRRKRRSARKKPKTVKQKPPENPINSVELRHSWSLEEIKIVYEAIKLTGGVDNVSLLTEVLPNKTAEEINTYITYCRRAQFDQWNKVKSMFDCDKPTTPLEFWLTTMDDLTSADGRWIRRAFSLALGILGKYEDPSIPVVEEDGEIAADEPNYGAIYNWLATLMLGFPEQPRALRHIDALIVLDLLDQLQQAAILRVSKNVPPLELLQRKHKLLKAPTTRKAGGISNIKRKISNRRVGMALAREDQCDLMCFTETQMKALVRNPPVEFDEGSGANWPPALKPGQKWVPLEGCKLPASEKGAKHDDDEWTDVSSSEEETEEQPQKLDESAMKGGNEPVGYAEDGANPLIIKRPFAQRLQGLNPFRLSKKYSRLELWAIPDGDDGAGTSTEL